MTFKAENNTLFYNGQKIFRAPGEIIDTLVKNFDDRILILYESYQFAPDKCLAIHMPKLSSQDEIDLIGRNVLMINTKGDVLWRIETDTDYAARYTYIREVGKRVYVGRSDDWRFLLDLRTGKISDASFMH